MVASTAGGAWGQWSQLLLLFILVSGSLWRLRSDLSFESLRPYGVTQTASRHLQVLTVALLLYCVGVTVVEILKGGAPIPLLLHVPIFAAVFVVVFMAGQLLPREALWHSDGQGIRTHINWGRFSKVMWSPIFAALAPITNVVVNRLPDIIKSFGL